MPDSPRIRVLLFARYAELLGKTELAVDLPDPATVGAVVAAVRSWPGGAGLPQALLVAVNARQSSLDTLLRPGDEVALLPPMAGG
jgi:molybdopterin converting factor subunit 1